MILNTFSNLLNTFSCRPMTSSNPSLSGAATQAPDAWSQRLQNLQAQEVSHDYATAWLSLLQPTAPPLSQPAELQRNGAVQVGPHQMQVDAQGNVTVSSAPTQLQMGLSVGSSVRSHGADPGLWGAQRGMGFAEAFTGLVETGTGLAQAGTGLAQAGTGLAPLNRLRNNSVAQAFSLSSPAQAPVRFSQGVVHLPNGQSRPYGNTGVLVVMSDGRQFGAGRNSGDSPENIRYVAAEKGQSITSSPAGATTVLYLDPHGNVEREERR